MSIRISFNELRRVKDELPSGSMNRIAEELGMDAETVRNYFGASHKDGQSVGIHIEPGPDGGIVEIDNSSVLEAAFRILQEQ